ncbi:MAG TPA: hypothetical protein VM529_15830 [Gemmata sp.]|nr:hypothetical protein [Gemmata sp.]
MLARLFVAIVIVTAIASTASSQDPPVAKLQPAKPPAADAPILKKLGEKISPGEIDINASLIEVLAKLSKQSGITFVVMEEHFKAAKVEKIRNGKSPLKKIEAEKLTLRTFLHVWLASMDATIIVRDDYLEIVPLASVQAGQPVAKLAK